MTTTHITTLLTIGVLISAGLAVLTEWVARRLPKHASTIRTWLPVALGLGLGATCFGLVYGQVVGPITFDWRWLGLGAFAGVCAGAGSKVAYDAARGILKRVLGG